jgi:predicted transcriptional regulator with HTH domain
MVTRKINLQEIRRQLIANIYNTLVDKGYNPEEGVDIEEELGDAPEIMVTGNNSLNYGDSGYTYSFNVGYIQFENENSFRVFNLNPYGDEIATDVGDEDFLIEGLAQLEDIADDLVGA